MSSSKSRLSRLALAAAVALGALGACAQREDHVVTQGGQTYVLFHGLDRACVHGGLVKELVDHGWTVTTASDSQLVAQQRAPAWINTAVLLASFDPPQVRMTLTIAPAGADVKVVIESGVLLDAGAGNQHIQPIHTTSQMTTVFNNSVRRIDQACRP